MTTKHTPGPWFTRYDNVFGQEGWQVRAPEGEGDRSEVVAWYLHEADARLIAAAPRLAETLRALLDATANCGALEEREAARAALEAAGVL